MKQSTIALALLPLLFTPVTKARTPEMPVLENRAAQGDITAPGGARRLTGDQTAALRDSLREGANKRGNSSRLTQSFHFFMFEPIFSPVNALNQPI